MKAAFRRMRSGRQGVHMYFDLKPMNKTYQFKPALVLLAALFMCIALAASLFTSAEEQDFGGSELSVKVEKKAVKVSVRTPKIVAVQFYMFNHEGRLIKQYDINGPKKFTIDELENGVYTYDFFSKDQRLKTGNIEIK